MQANGLSQKSTQGGAGSKADFGGPPGNGVYLAEPVWMPDYENYVARGGAVSALFLGIMSIIGGILTPIAIFQRYCRLAAGILGSDIDSKANRDCGNRVVRDRIFAVNGLRSSLKSHNISGK